MATLRLSFALVAACVIAVASSALVDDVKTVVHSIQSPEPLPLPPPVGETFEEYCSRICAGSENPNCVSYCVWRLENWPDQIA